MSQENDFRQWASRMGYNQRQVATAGEQIGINNKWTASSTATGKRELTRAERLAMSAVRFGLKPWTPEYDDELTEARKELPPATSG